MADLARPRVVSDIVEEHFEELDFLWDQRERVIFAADWNLQELREHEERCDAHLDGLKLAQGHAADLALEALGAGERGPSTAATLVLLALGHPDLDRRLLEAFAAAEGDGLDGMRIGLRHAAIARVLPALQALAGAGEPLVRAAALDVLAFHRLAPPPDFEPFVAQAEPAVLRKLYPAIGRFARSWNAARLRAALEDEDEAAHRAALEASARAGLAELPSTCRQVAGSGGPGAAAALEFLGVVGSGDDHEIEFFRKALDRTESAIPALAGLGALGDPAAVPLLIDAMAEDALSAHAGLAFARITGAEGFERDEPLPPPQGLSEEELDFWEPGVAADPDRAGRWWQEEKGRFATGSYWQNGEDCSASPLGGTFDTLPLGSRRDVYLRCRAKDRAATPDLELEGRAATQLARETG